MTKTISIIIPTLNEERVLERTLSRLQNRENCEMIVVDGGSSDSTLTLAQKAGCKIISGPRGRGKQMNLGATESSGEFLLFLHADTLLPPDFPRLIIEATKNPTFAAGAFSLAIDSSLKRLASIAWLANLRSRLLQLPYGDQALFCRRSLFDTMGGFPEIEIMEDFVFIGKMRKKGAIITLPECATTSARRWQNLGIIRTTVINQLIVCGYGLGVSPAVLAKWYQRVRGVCNKP